MNIRQLFFEFQYRFSKPPWDSGITPPEVTGFVANHPTRGRALDLGCGTGTNAVYLARHGFQVVGVDFSTKAIATARAKARRANLAIDFHTADVTRLDFLREPFDYVLDIGCFHALDPARRDDYVAHLARLTRPGGVFMLYAFSPRPANEREHLLRLQNVGATPDEVRQRFARAFALERIEQGADRGERVSAWFWFKRQSSVNSKQ
ncbi:MAG: class I SAM-dependent methyltransferase [Chloroflexi bacterium]|nr:class I SAM-dependent methyltransferase [Chloroflexota bacterium]